MKKFFKTILYTAVLLISLNAFAGEDDDPDALPGDPGAAPIDDYMPLVIIGATALGFYFLKKKEVKPV